MSSTPRLNSLDVSSLVKKIEAANSIILSTHKQCDGDGLGAQLGLFHALKKLGKNVRVLCVDEVPKKYRFLEPEKYLEVYEGPHAPIDATDLALIFDTNDRRIVEPLYSELSKKCSQILFVDHHPVLNQGPEPTAGSFIDTRAASTGEIAYFIVKELGIRLDANIARALYTSIAFDTQIFRYVRNSSTSHLICAELLEFERNPEEIHAHLFSTYTAGKVAFLAKMLSEIEYFGDGRVAVLRIKSEDLSVNHLDMDDSRDVIDMIMNISAVQVAALFRQDEPNGYKLSLRSKGKLEILGVAEHFEGGGHMSAAGAFVRGDYNQIKLDVVSQLLQRLDNIPSRSKNRNGAKNEKA